ncbi:hypothetical protein PV341_22215 [Streptomyces sp. PA03-1a]|nr:hypothetical protein [Streptomyces sp. PA03-1a]MDX2817131.1 hypothetical protein [Streptomyces sp. PA03-5A]
MGRSRIPEIQREHILAISERAIGVLAPQELPQLNAYGQAFFTDRSRTLRLSRPDTATEAVGFGLAELVEVVTPLVLAAVADAVLPPAQNFLCAWGRRIWNRLRGTTQGPERLETESTADRNGRDPLASLTADQLIRVRQTALAVSGRMGWDDNVSTLFADSLLGALTITAAPENRSCE